MHNPYFIYVDETKYICVKQNHVEGYLELSAKTKTYFSTAVALWDAEFYVKVDDDVHVNLGKLKKYSACTLNN